MYSICIVFVVLCSQ